MTYVVQTELAGSIPKALLNSRLKKTLLGVHRLQTRFVIQFRHPCELGRLYWTANMFMTLLASFVCVWVGDGGKMEWTLVGVASGAWILSFMLFVLLMKKDYRGTLWSSKLGKDATCELFASADDDVKAKVFECNKKQWIKIRPLVKVWVLDNWWRWRDENPEWFTVSLVAKVSEDMIPEEEDREKLRAMRGRGERRGSAADVLDGEVIAALGGSPQASPRRVEKRQVQPVLM